MKKLFLTSGLVVCIACSVFAATDIPSGVNSSQCTYTYLDSYTGPVAFEAKWRSAYSGAITLNSNKYASSDANSAVQYSATTAVSPSTVYSKYGDALYASCDCSNSTCSTAQASVTEPTLTGYDFGGFYTGKEGTGTQVIDDSGDVLSAANTQISTNCDTATWYAKWTPQEHTVSYSCGSAPVGASVSMSAYCDDTNDEDCSDDVDYDASYTVKTTPGDCVLSGYHFGGWQCDYNLFSGVHTSTTYNSALSNDVYSVTASGAFKSVANVDCDATWTANTYTVSYAMDGGTHGASHPESATYDATFNVSNPTKANNVFTGWTISGMDSGTHEYGATNSLGTTTTNTTLTTNAEYFKNLRSTSGTVTFTAGWEACTACNAGTGCSCELSVVNNTCTYTTSANNGYTLTSGNGTATPVCTAVGSDITLSSTEASNHGTTIIYGKYNVGAYLDSARTTQLMSTSSNAITIPERSGYTFNGYYDSASNGTQYIGSNGNITTDGDNAAKGYTTNQTWYAQWTQCTACNAGTGCSCELSVVNNTCTYTTSANTGYTLTSGNGTATPVCTANTYTVSYTMDGGTQGASHPESATYDATFNVSNPTKDGYTFSGWTISGMDSGTHEYGATNSLGTTTTNTTLTTNAEYFKNLRSTSGTVTFTAGWEACTACNAGTGCSCELSVVNNTCTYTTSASIGYTLTSGNGTATPVCTANTYTVSYAMDGGTHGASHPESATYDATFNVSNPTKTNNVFTGWTISGMDSGTHEYGATNSLGTTTTNTTLTTTAEYFKNLRSTSGTVTFTAGWEACTACNAGAGCSCELSVVNNTCTYTTSANNGYTLTSGNGTATPVCTAVGSDITLSSTEASNHGTTIIYGKYNVGAYLDSARTTQLMSTSSNAITIPERSGYTFNGYYDSASNGTQYIGSNGNITTDGDNAAKGYTTNQTWYAQWTQCTACNAGTGCSCELSVVNNTCTYTTSANNGYTLTSGNGTATPVCTANTYTVSYTMDGGTQGASHPESATYDATFNVSNPTKDGYTFSGWTISGMDSGTHEYGATNSLGTTTTGTTVTTDAEYFKNLRSTSGTVTFTAGWDADPIPVTFKCLYPNGHTSSDAGASGPTPAIMKIRMDGYATLSSVCTLSGYTFQGWSCSGLTNSSGAALTGTITNGTTVYLHNSSGALCEGVWAPNEIDLTWYLDSGATTGLTVQSAADMCLYDDDITFPTNSMIKNGYSFNGWRLR